VPPPRPRRLDRWKRPLAVAAAAGLLGSALLGGFEHGLGPAETIRLLLGGALGVALILHRGAHVRSVSTAPARLDTPETGADRGKAADVPGDDSPLARGVEDIRRMDPRFEPDRFAGYAAMTFRDAQSARMSLDIGPLRDRMTAEVFDALQARCDELRRARRVNRVEQIDIAAEITEAWHEDGRDYVTACIRGSLVDYVVDEHDDGVVLGSRATPRHVEEFWTFTRPGGLNFWMLSAIQAS
jgi:predicted lipid-binding transport protein (Tim44 family)